MHVSVGQPGHMRHLLRRSRHLFLATQLQQLPEQAPASTVLRLVHRNMGPTNPKKVKRKSLPFLKNAEGQVCANSQELVDCWVEFFGAMEGGQGKMAEQFESFSPR